MANKHMKRYSASLIIREIQIKTTMRNYLKPVRMGIIKKSTSNKYWRGCGEKRILLPCWWECKLIQPLWKRVWRFFRKLEIKPPSDPEIPLLGIYTEESEVSKVAQLCSTPWTVGLPGSPIHGTFQARVLEWVAISFSKGSSQPRDRTLVYPHCELTLYHLSH